MRTMQHAQNVEFSSGTYVSTGIHRNDEQLHVDSAGHVISEYFTMDILFLFALLML
jgi:hypothetical protein